MAFGQPAGPPASARQLAELLELLREAGHDGFRDARGPMGFTQRQAGGKFTVDEAAGFIERLQDEQFVAGTAAPTAPAAPRPTAKERALRDVPTALLAAELQRRGWVVLEP